MTEACLQREKGFMKFCHFPFPYFEPPLRRWVWVERNFERVPAVAGGEKMGRFAEDAHTDLRQWHGECLDFRILRQSLIEDPPDPWDDHPSMAGPIPAASSIPSTVSSSGLATAAVTGGATSSPTDDSTGVRRRKSDSNLAQHWVPLLGGGIGSDGRGAGGDEEAVTEGGAAGDGIFFSFSDPATRVFVFELHEALKRVWEFYREQTDVCGAKLSSLYDRSASSRHKLHRKLGGAPTGVAAPVADAGFGGDASPGGGGESCSTPSKSNFDLLGAVGRTEGFLNNSIAAAQELLLTGSPETTTTTSKPRIRGRKSAISPPPTPRGSGGAGDGASVGLEEANLLQTTEDPYVRASLKRCILELYDTCHRLLSFKMLNYDACVRLVELHCRRREAEGLSVPRSGLGMASPASAVWSINGGGEGANGVGEGLGATPGSGSPAAVEGTSFLHREKSMKMWLLEHPLFASRDLNSTLGGAELLYASLFCNGDVDVARTSLTFKASSSIRGNRRFDFGYRLGVATVLLAWAGWDWLADPSLGKDLWTDPAYQVFRGTGNVILLTYMWGVNIWVWRRFGIDYQRCLSLDPKGPRVDPCEQVWNTGCNLSIAFLVSFICFYKALRGVLVNEDVVPPVFAHTFPLLLFLYVIITFLTPWSERKSLLKVIWTVVISPFGTVRFLEGYVGDILTSVVKVLIDVAFALVYFTSLVKGGWLTTADPLSPPSVDSIKDWRGYSMVIVPFLTAAPLWWRFQQNIRRSYETRQRWPHLGNALKYATAMSVSLFGTFQPAAMHKSPLWVLCFVIATLYQYTWDIFMDWDLLRWDGRSFRLRPRLLYRKKSLYITVALVNLVLRFLWTTTLIPDNNPWFPTRVQNYLNLTIAAAEIMRRTMWGFLRVENEHLSIYRSVDGLGSDTDSQGQSLLSQAEATYSPSVSAAAMSSMGGSGDPINTGGGSVSGGGISWWQRSSRSFSRGTVLDRLPYSPMDMNSKHGVGITAAPNNNPVKAWCLIRVKADGRARLFGELCAFTAALATISMLAWMLRSKAEDAM